MRCPQGRVKAEIIFKQVADELSKYSSCFNQIKYRRYLLALHVFLKKHKERQISEKKRIAATLVKLKEEKSKMILQRADLISADMFDLHSKELFNEKITELTETIDDLNYQKKNLTQK
jgi:hypothetical protein